MSGDGGGPTSKRNLRGLIGSQFFGAFNDNLYKQLVLLLGGRILFPGEDLQGVATIVFAVPFIVFSGLAGELSERYSKRRIIVTMKAAEVGIMLAGVFALHTMNWSFLLAVLFLMGTHSAFFGPSKYGVIPEIVRPEGLVAANGVIQMTTFIAILGGQALTGILVDELSGQLWISGAVCAGLAVVGLLIALRIGPLAPRRPDLRIGANPFAGLVGTVLSFRKRPVLFAALVGNSLFWFNGGVLNQAVTGMGGAAWLDIPTDQNWKLSALMVSLAVGIMTGSVTAPAGVRSLGAPRMALGGAVAMLVIEGLLLLVGPVLGPGTATLVATGAVLYVAGFAGAWFVVPVTSYLQHGPGDGERGRAFAANNFMNWICVLLSGAWYLGSAKLGISPALAAVTSGVVMVAYVVAQRRHLATMSFTS